MSILGLSAPAAPGPGGQGTGVATWLQGPRCAVARGTRGAVVDHKVSEGFSMVFIHVSIIMTMSLCLEETSITTYKTIYFSYQWGDIKYDMYVHCQISCVRRFSLLVSFYGFAQVGRFSIFKWFNVVEHVDTLIMLDHNWILILNYFGKNLTPYRSMAQKKQDPIG